MTLEALLALVVMDVIAGKTLVQDAIDVVNAFGRMGLNLGQLPGIEQALQFLVRLQANSPPTVATGTDDARAKAAAKVAEYVAQASTAKPDTFPDGA